MTCRDHPEEPTDQYETLQLRDTVGQLQAEERRQAQGHLGMPLDRPLHEHLGRRDDLADRHGFRTRLPDGPCAERRVPEHVPGIYHLQDGFLAPERSGLESFAMPHARMQRASRGSPTQGRRARHSPASSGRRGPAPRNRRSPRSQVLSARRPAQTRRKLDRRPSGRCPSPSGRRGPLGSGRWATGSVTRATGAPPVALYACTRGDLDHARGRPRRPAALSPGGPSRVAELGSSAAVVE